MDWESLSEEEWQQRLTPEQYRVLRNHGTERAFTGDLHDNKKQGMYVCAACGEPLFSSDDKFDSGTGWPSFSAPMEDTVGTKKDFKMIIPRTEVHCKRCGGHLGHVFSDGPKPTKKRFCINSCSLKFKE